MPIPEAQLETWSHQGSITQSSTTYNSIKGVLEGKGTPYTDKNFKVFLQGSYGNDTNIYSESDVDIVIRLDDCFQRDISGLTDTEQEVYKASVTDATYTQVEFKSDVLGVLNGAYGKAVAAGDKAIAIAASGARRKSDVIVALQFRRYFSFTSVNDARYAEGICFWNSKGERIANYPKQHSSNLTKKHQNTANWFKPTARVFKNMRSKMVDEGLIEAGLAPSYYIEGLLYNVPDDKFTGSYQDCVVNALNWYRQNAIKADLVCANEQYYLLRDGSNVCWTQQKCDAFVDAACELWKGW